MRIRTSRTGDPVDLHERSHAWTELIRSRPTSEVLAWITGTKEPRAAAQAEAVEQLDRLLTRLDSAPGLAPVRRRLPSRGGRIVSGYRSFNRQEAIWLRKFEFRGAPFDRISTAAREICGSLLSPGDIRWDPADPRHRACWGVRPLVGSPAPSFPSGTRCLTSDERQREILQASGAPGLSRHHWGTDFDLFDPELDPVEWQEGGRWWPAFRWLRDQAPRLGFVDPYRDEGTSTGARMAEPWHWSYRPIGDALLAFARVEHVALQEALVHLWGDTAHLSFLRSHWRNYLF